MMDRSRKMIMVALNKSIRENIAKPSSFIPPKKRKKRGYYNEDEENSDPDDPDFQFSDDENHVDTDSSLSSEDADDKSSLSSLNIQTRKLRARRRLILPQDDKHGFDQSSSFKNVTNVIVPATAAAANKIHGM